MPAEDSSTPPAQTVVCLSQESLKAVGAEADGKVTVGAYAIRFADGSEPDLVGDHFTKSTNFGPSNGNGVPAMFNHGMCPPGAKGLEAVCEMTFGAVKTTKDDVGLFVETVLDKADKYQKAIADLVARGKLKWSTGAGAHALRKTDGGEIKQWLMCEVSFTPSPCEPRLPAIRPLDSAKSVELDAEVLSDLSAALAVDNSTPADTQRSPSPEKTTVKVMPEDLTPAQLQENAVKARNLEVQEILAFGKKFNCSEAAAQHVAGNKSLFEFKDHILKDVVKAEPVVTSPIVGLSKKEIGKYSIVKAMREWIHGGSAKAVSGLEKEASEATATAIKKTPDGFFIPHDVATANMADSNNLGTEALKALATAINTLKTLNQTTFSQGGALVGTNVLTGSIIELLRNKPLVSSMGAMTLTGLVGNVAIPRINGGASAYWLNEQGPATNSDQAFGQVGFMPKRLVGRTGYTKELINQTDLSIEALVRNDLTTVMAIEKDRAALFGTGGAQPLGIANTTGINAVTFGGTASRAKMIEFQAKVATGNASRGALAYMTSPAAAAKLMNVPVATGYPTFLWDGNVDTGNVVGRRAETTNQLGLSAGDRMVYGNWNDLVLLDWAGIDVVVNPYSQDSQGIVTITITLWTDSGLRHEVSFAFSTDSAAQ